MSDVFNPQTSPAKLNRWAMLGLALTGLLLTGFLWQPLSRVVFPESVDKQHAASVHLALPKDTRYDFLRQADFLGNRFVMLRHHHTSQRIILLIGPTASGQTYNSLFKQPLSAFHFMLLMKVFQAQSTFHDKTLNVLDAHPSKAGSFRNKTFRLPYKTYIVTTTVDGKPSDFEAYVGKIVYNHKSQGLVFTFNSKDAVAQEALTDLLDVLKPVEAAPAS